MSHETRMQLIDRLLSLLAHAPRTLAEIELALVISTIAVENLLLSLCSEGIVEYTRQQRRYHIAQLCDLRFLEAA